MGLTWGVDLPRPQPTGSVPVPFSHVIDWVRTVWRRWWR